MAFVPSTSGLVQNPPSFSCSKLLAAHLHPSHHSYSSLMSHRAASLRWQSMTPRRLRLKAQGLEQPSQGDFSLCSVQTEAGPGLLACPTSEPPQPRLPVTARFWRPSGTRASDPHPGLQHSGGVPGSRHSPGVGLATPQTLGAPVGGTV
jgi:hypothetical protein